MNTAEQYERYAQEYCNHRWQEYDRVPRAGGDGVERIECCEKCGATRER